jgi:branched-chain amino acid transport system permease protein
MLGAIYALIALGYTMVYGVLRLINFAHGDVYMVGAFVGLYAARALHLTDETGTVPVPAGALFLMILIAMIASAALGVTIERLAYKPLRRAPRLTALITAIGVSMFLEYGGQRLFGTTPQSYPQLASAAGQARADMQIIGGVSISRIDMIIFVVAAALVIILQLIVHRTRPGKAMRAVSYDREAASLMGINPDTIITMTFLIGSAFAGAAGVLVGMRTRQVEPLMGLMAGIKAFVAAVVGGIGSVPGAALGGLAMGISEEIVKAFYPGLTDAVVFGVLILILVLRPTGILGTGAVEKA